MYAACKANTTCMFIPLSLNCYSIIEFFILEFFCKHGRNLYVYYLMCVLLFLDYYVTYCYNLIFLCFSGRELRRAPARRFSLPVNPEM